MADLKRIIDDIKEMKVTEVAELIKMMEEEFGVSAAPVAVAGGPVAVAEVVEEKTEFNVKLKSMGANKVSVIKAVRELTGLGLVEAKNLVEALGVVKEGIPKAEAETYAAKLRDAGAEAVVE